MENRGLRTLCNSYPQKRSNDIKKQIQISIQVEPVWHIKSFKHTYKKKKGKRRDVFKMHIEICRKKTWPVLRMREGRSFNLTTVISDQLLYIFLVYT